MANTHLVFKDLGHWTEVSGRIDYAFTKNITVGSCGGADCSGRRTAEIRYTYDVDGREYVGYRVALLDFVYMPRSYSNLPSGSNVKVFISPVDPAESLLTKEYPVEAMVQTAFFATVCLTFGIWFRQILGILQRTILHQE